ncbi:hypothetical protein KM043_008334 [Ampulex compressa]|nr:hypothetical protein KM043_008334 [Ampulex compressa]
MDRKWAPWMHGSLRERSSNLQLMTDSAVEAPVPLLSGGSYVSSPVPESRDKNHARVIGRCWVHPVLGVAGAGGRLLADSCLRDSKSLAGPPWRATSVGPPGTRFYPPRRRRNICEGIMLGCFALLPPRRYHEDLAAGGGAP